MLSNSNTMEQHIIYISPSYIIKALSVNLFWESIQINQTNNHIIGHSRYSTKLAPASLRLENLAQVGRRLAQASPFSPKRDTLRSKIADESSQRLFAQKACANLC